MAAQAGLCLAWSETPEDTFCHVASPIYMVKRDDGQNISEHTLHRYHLLHLDNKLLDMPETLDDQMIKPHHEKNYD